MDIEFSQSGMRLTGKAWQIKAKLREWSKHSLTVQEFLLRQSRTQKHHAITIVK